LASIALADTNIYVSGFLLRNNGGSLSSAGAVYWKNVARVNLTNCGPLDASDAAGLAVSGLDVYVAGFILTDGPGYDTAVIWKNGVLVPNLYTTEGNAFPSIISAITIVPN